jgi:hypothetical protein
MIRVNLLALDDEVRQQLAFDLAKFLKELQSIHDTVREIYSSEKWH